MLTKCANTSSRIRLGKIKEIQMGTYGLNHERYIGRNLVPVNPTPCDLERERCRDISLELSFNLGPAFPVMFPHGFELHFLPECRWFSKDHEPPRLGIQSRFVSDVPLLNLFTTSALFIRRGR